MQTAPQQTYFQFGFKNHHSKIFVIAGVFVRKEYCLAVFLYVSQAFDRLWHQDLIYKMSKMFPKNYSQRLESYLSKRQFTIFHESDFSKFHPISAGIPQGSVLRPHMCLRCSIRNSDRNLRSAHGHYGKRRISTKDTWKISSCSRNSTHEPRTGK